MKMETRDRTGWRQRKHGARAVGNFIAIGRIHRGVADGFARGVGDFTVHKQGAAEIDDPNQQQQQERQNQGEFHHRLCLRSSF